MQWFYVRSMRRRITACNSQQMWPYKILIEKLQELEEAHTIGTSTGVLTRKQNAKRLVQVVRIIRCKINAYPNDSSQYSMLNEPSPVLIYDPVSHLISHNQFF